MSHARGSFQTCLTAVLTVCSGCDRVERLQLFPSDASIPPSAPLLVTEDKDLSADNSEGRSCPDGGDAVAYSVVALGEDTVELATIPAAGCLNPGDEAVLVNLQGRPEASNSVGRRELVQIRGVAGAHVTLASRKRRFYGDRADNDANIGVGPDTQRVMFQRVPRYARLKIEHDATLTARAWNGRTGGVLVMRVDGDVLVHGGIRMDGRGYRGGRSVDLSSSPGEQGESIQGRGEQAVVSNIGGGGGGIGDLTTYGCEQYGYAGGGGGHVVPGNRAEMYDPCRGAGAGAGGLAYGRERRLLFGSGGGSGGTDNSRADNPPSGAGGAGGGIIWILAHSIVGGGSISADGAPGEGDPESLECVGSSVVDCYDYSGPGGGGAGGSVMLSAARIEVGRISTSGGRGGNGNDHAAGDGGNGGNGLVALD